MNDWTCTRQSEGVKCGHRNEARKRKCALCGKPKPAKRVPAHMMALDLYTYEDYIRLNGGVERCGICGRPPSARRRLDRDHDHHTGLPRGLLCARDNQALPSWITSKWLRAAADYLDRGILKER